MGFFSWDCKACGHSIRATDATNTDSEWLSQAVLVEPDGSTLRGGYDGYGRLVTRSGRELEIGDGPSPCLYHQACFDLMKPTDRKPSHSARDQGFFVGDYDPKKPRSREDVEALAKAAKERAEADKAAARKALDEERAEIEAKGEPVPEWLLRATEGPVPQALISIAKASERA